MDFVNQMTDQGKDTLEAEGTKLQAQFQGHIEEQVSSAMGNLGLKAGDGDAEEGEEEEEDYDEEEEEEEGGEGASERGIPGADGEAGEGGCKKKHGGGGRGHKKHGGRGRGRGRGGGRGRGRGRGGGKHGGRGGGGCHADDDDDDEFDSEITAGIKADVRMFSGCEDSQTSADVHDVAKFGLPDACGAGGACTNAVLVNLKDQKPDSWMSLLKGMRGTLKEKKFAQVPQLATSKKIDINSPFSFSGGGDGKHKALLVGINYVGCGQGELKGCHNDVASMLGYIPEHGYPSEAGPDLKIIMDDGNHQEPTKENIVDGIKWLVNGAESGDSLFMHYSGHGGSVRDLTGDEEDCKDETMVPVDYAKSGQIKDDDILATLVMPLPEGVTLSVVMDCCHSGSILDLPYSFDANDGALELVDGGGSGVTKKKKNFNMKKMKKAHGKK